MGWFAQSNTMMKKRHKYPVGGRREPFPVRVQLMVFGLFKGLFFLICLFASVWLGWRLHYFLFQSPYFRLKKVEVMGISPALAEEALKYACLDDLKGHNYNLLKLRLGVLKRRLMKLPKLRTVQLHKEYPSTLRILAQPRKAVVIVAGDGLFLADSDGVVMERLSPEKRKSVDFPIITGIPEKDVAPGKVIQTSSFFKALDIQAALIRHCDKLYAKLSEMHLGQHGTITAIFERGTEVRFGRKDALRRLPELHAFIEKYASGGRNLQNFRFVDLRFNKQIVYALRSEPSVKKRRLVNN